MFRAIPRAQLAVVPGTTHASIFEKLALVDGMITEFLKEQPRHAL
jgi:hypothetical protein